MQVKNITECSKGSILWCFWPSLSYHLSFIRSLFCLFLVAVLHRFYCIVKKKIQQQNKACISTTHTELNRGSYMSAHVFLCPQRNFGRHIVMALSIRPSRFRVRSISPIFFEVGIPNLVCGYILGWRSVTYHFRVTVTLTSDLVFKIIVSGAYLILFEVGISNLVCGYILGWRSVVYHIWVTVTLNLTSDLVSRNCIESGAYLLYSLR